MNKKLTVHNAEGSEYKYSTVGNIRPNKSGKDMIGLMVSRIEPAIQRAKEEAAKNGVAADRVWLNIMMFDEDNNQAQQPSYQPQKEAVDNTAPDLEDEVPF